MPSSTAFSFCKSPWRGMPPPPRGFFFKHRDGSGFQTRFSEKGGGKRPLKQTPQVIRLVSPSKKSPKQPVQFMLEKNCLLVRSVLALLLGAGVPAPLLV
jgi:hypothetical protein